MKLCKMFSFSSLPYEFTNLMAIFRYPRAGVRRLPGALQRRKSANKHR